MQTSISPQSLRELEATWADIARADERMSLRLAAEVALITNTLKEAVGREFVAGKDKHGESHDKTGETLKTLDSHSMGLLGEVTMGGAASLVEFGSKAHVIEARNMPFLHFQTYGGEWVRTQSVHHPGYAGDDFVGRAILDTEVQTAIAASLNAIGVSFLGTRVAP